MSAQSGIEVAQQLLDVFSDAVQDGSIRFLKVSIRNERLVPDSSLPKSGQTLEEDLYKLPNILQDKTPAYVLTRLDGDSAGWMVINWVPDDALVRDKMLYASTRSSLTKCLGTGHFSDSLFATSKADLTPEAYAAHLRHMDAPKPQTAQEKDMQLVREAERGGALEGSKGRRNHVGAGVGLVWSEEAEVAVKEVGQSEKDMLLLLSIDIETEALIVVSANECSIGRLSAELPISEPSFAFFAWKHNHSPSPRRDIIFIYSCPSTSPIKNRMVYSLSAASLLHSAKAHLSDSASNFVSKKLETSDPKEVTESFVVSQLNLDRKNPEEDLQTSRPGSSEPKGFARPKGPGRKR